jgi:hypothetical protein
MVDPLCNFAAEITEEVTLDNGVETSKVFVINGTLATGERLPTIRVPASRFAAMSWVPEQWGARAIVNAGPSIKDSLRAAIQRLSRRTIPRRVFTHCGWREVASGEWAFLTAAGSVGRDDIEVDLDPALSRYALPVKADDPVAAMKASLQLLKVAPLRVTVPLWAAVFRAPLAHAWPIDLSLWLEGMTGSLKSTLAALFLCHFGDFDRLHLPGSWVSTANQLESRAFTLKDTLFVIDDYAPRAALDERELHAKAARVLRAQGNLAGRGRLRSDLTERPAMPPRGFLLSTGEQHPPGQSILARLFLVQMHRADVNRSLLTTAQTSAAVLPHAMAGYLSWLAPQMAELSSRLRDFFISVRADAGSAGGHLRVPEGVAHLWTGFAWGTAYAEDIGACTPAFAGRLREQAWEALLAIGDAQGTLVEEERPTLRYLRLLSTQITQGRVTLASNKGSGTSTARDLLGWFDDTRLYLLPDAAFKAVAEFARATGQAFPITEDRLRRELAEEELTEHDEGRHLKMVRLGGFTRRVLCLLRKAVDQALGEPFPIVAGVSGHGE